MRNRKDFRPTYVRQLETRALLSGPSSALVASMATRATTGGTPVYIPSTGDGTGVAHADLAFTMEQDGLVRRYIVHVPKGYDGKSTLPVVMGFHGAYSNAVIFAVQSHLDTLSDQAGFLVVYPEGTGTNSTTLSWNAGRNAGYAAQHNVDDVRFIGALLDKIATQYKVDLNRVYATGLSNGAMMCYRLAREMSDRIAAIAPVAGGDLQLDTAPPPGDPVPVIDFHGKLDPIVPYDGGLGLSGIIHPSVTDVVSHWAVYDQDPSQPTSVESTSDYVKTAYEPTSVGTGAPVVLYTILNGGHTWPGGTVLDPTLNLGPLVKTVDATSIIWNFFRQFSTSASTSSNSTAMVSTTSTMTSHTSTSSDTTAMVSTPSPMTSHTAPIAVNVSRKAHPVRHQAALKSKAHQAPAIMRRHHPTRVLQPIQRRARVAAAGSRTVAN